MVGNVLQRLLGDSGVTREPGEAGVLGGALGPAGT